MNLKALSLANLLKSSYGGIGRRDRFKICCLKGRTGSIPVKSKGPQGIKILRFYIKGKTAKDRFTAPQWSHKFFKSPVNPRGTAF